MSEKTIIEVNGVKLEVDMRYAKRVEELRVGDKVKILTKTYSDWEVNPGVIVGFEPFKNRPTIIAAYADSRWSTDVKIKFVHYNTSSKDIEIVRADDDDLDFDREQILANFDRTIETKRREIAEIEEHKRYFVTNFKQYWELIEPPISEDA